MMILTLMAVLMIGCGEEEVPESSTADILGTMKVPDTVAAAPQAPGIGMPFVKEVKYFRDWKLTQEVQESVLVGDTVFVKVVFSEPMKHVVSDDKNARPKIFHTRAGTKEQWVRFKMVAHDAKGADFSTGDVKPIQAGTDTYVCKYKVVPEDAGREMAIKIGRWSKDLQGNPLAASYTHQVKLRIKPAAAQPVQAEDPEPAALEPLTIVSITHYPNGSNEPIPEGESVDAGTTIVTAIDFSMPVRANSVVISYPVGFATKHLYQSTGVHWRETYQVSKDGTTVRSKLNASGEIFSLTIERAASLDGNILKQSVAAPEIQVVPRPQPIVVEPEEPAINSPATTIQQVPQPVPGADDFVGGVYIPNPRHNDVLRSGVFPVSGATVIIVSGSRSGERVTTGQNGRYVFQGVAESSLHLRVEKSDLEPKEVIVHRTRATTLADGTSLLKYIDDPQHTAGNILVGHRIPSAARSILDIISVVDDLLYVNSGSYTRYNLGGWYMNGVAVVVNGDPHVIAHEFFHAHQHALTFVDGWFSGSDWLDTPEGSAYVQAKEKDLRQFSKSTVDRTYGDIDWESSAEVFAMYWSGSGDLKQKAPNRYRWAQEWFGR